MFHLMYAWRRMTEEERREVLRARQLRGGSWRRPPVWDSGMARYLITGACFEHAPLIGHSLARMDAFEAALLTLCHEAGWDCSAHVVLPNHYHLLVEGEGVASLRRSLGRLHGRTAREWNLEEGQSGRKVFHGSAETLQKSERHFWASLNYMHHNPVKHGYVARWQDWPWSSAQDFLRENGREEALRIWNAYPVDRYGDGWDD